LDNRSRIQTSGASDVFLRRSDVRA
jgi:hypothetical protein